MYYTEAGRQFEALVSQAFHVLQLPYVKGATGFKHRILPDFYDATTHTILDVKLTRRTVFIDRKKSLRKYLESCDHFVVLYLIDSPGVAPLINMTLQPVDHYFESLMAAGYQDLVEQLVTLRKTIRNKIEFPCSRNWC